MRAVAGPTCRSAWTPTAPGRWEAEAAARARSRRPRAVRGARPRARTDPRAQRTIDVAARDRRDHAGARRARPPGGDAVCLKIARGGGISGVIEQAAAPAPPATRSISPRPSTAPWASPRPCTPPPRSSPTAPCGLATLGVFADRTDRCPPQPAGSPLHRPGPRRQPARLVPLSSAADGCDQRRGR